MNEDGKTHNDAVEKELEGVPEQFRDAKADRGDDSEDARLTAMETELENLKQQVLYARAETQNVRRRLEKDIADARTYAATGFARDVLSVADNLTRALEAVPADMRSHNQLEGLIAGIEATQRELEKVLGQHGISRIASVGLPLDPHQHQAMIEIPSAEHEPGVVVSEMQSGYMIKDRLLRPALVAVAKQPD